MPEVRSFGTVDKSTLGLLPAQIEELCGLVFVNLDLGAAPLAEMVGDLPEHLARYRIPSLVPFSASLGQQAVTWQIAPDGVAHTRDTFMAYRPRRPGPRTRLVQRLNAKLNTLVAEEDADLVANLQAGLATRDFKPGPLSAREAPLAWFAGRVRADLGEVFALPDEHRYRRPAVAAARS